MAFLRECVGDKLILGCGVPIGAAIGVVDACRISCDVDLYYKGMIFSRIQVANEMLNARSAINNSIFRRHMNGRVWMNDPDVFFLRENNLKFTDVLLMHNNKLQFTNEQKYLLGKINNLCGNVLFVSDNAGDYDKSAQALVRKFFEKTDEKIISADYLDSEIIKLVTEKDGKRSTFTFNLEKGKILSDENWQKYFE